MPKSILCAFAYLKLMYRNYGTTLSDVVSCSIVAIGVAIPSSLVMMQGSLISTYLCLFCRHTGVVVYGKEYFYGGMGIEFCAPVRFGGCLESSIYEQSAVEPLIPSNLSSYSPIQKEGNLLTKDRVAGLIVSY